MIREIVEYKTESDWLDLRKKDVTSTEVSALFGLSPYMTEFELYHLKQSGELMEFKETERITWGKRMEATIAEGVGEDLGLKVQPLKNYQRIPVSNMGASFDYEVLSGDKKGWLIEVKNVDWRVYKDKWTEDEAPEHIEVQIQCQMWVADRPGCILIAMVGGNDPHIIERKRDDLVCKAMQKKVEQFWRDIDKGKEPKPDYSKDADLIISLHQNSRGEVLDLTDDVVFQQDLMSYEALKSMGKNIEKELKAKKAEFLDRIGDDYSKVKFEGYSISCGMMKDTPKKEITQEMVGTFVGGRKGSRLFKVTRLKEAK